MENKTYTVTFSDGTALTGLVMEGGNFYVPESINCVPPVTVSCGDEQRTYQNAALVERDSKCLLLFWNTDSKSWSFTLADGSKLENLERLPNGYFISQTEVTGQMFRGEVILSDGETERVLEGLEISQRLTVNGKHWFHLRDFGEEGYSITLEDGTTLTGLRKNGGCYISKTAIDPAVFEDNCGTVILRGSGADPMFDDESNLHHNLELDRLWEEDGKWQFVLRQLSEEELEKQQLQQQIKLLVAQNKALADRGEFLEDCIAEMAAAVYE